MATALEVADFVLSVVVSESWLFEIIRTSRSDVGTVGVRRG